MDPELIKLMMANISDAIRNSKETLTDEEIAIAIFRVIGKERWRGIINQF